VPAWQFLYAENDRVAMHQRRYRRGALVKKLRSVGFTIERASYVNALLFPADRSGGAAARSSSASSAPARRPRPT
jgi:hypothetical protein